MGKNCREIFVERRNLCVSKSQEEEHFSPGVSKWDIYITSSNNEENWPLRDFSCFGGLMYTHSSLTSGLSACQSLAAVIHQNS